MSFAGIGRGAVVAVAVFLGPAIALGDSAAAPARRFRAIEVDVSGVRASGDAVSADWVARELPADLRKTFAACLSPADRGAPILRARVDLVTLGANGSGGGLNSTQAVDYIEGAGEVIGAGGHVIASYPLLSAVHAYPDDVDANGVSGRLRVSNLALSFANWLPGKMGL
jgi:hypothetical protein